MPIGILVIVWPHEELFNHLSVPLKLDLYNTWFLLWLKWRQIIILNVYILAFIVSHGIKTRNAIQFIWLNSIQAFFENYSIQFNSTQDMDKYHTLQFICEMLSIQFSSDQMNEGLWFQFICELLTSLIIIVLHRFF